MFNDSLGFADSYYLATANPAPDEAALDGGLEADLAVVGGGCTGLSAALHAAERGLSVILLEGGRIGWGASGRNGGQIIPGLRQGPAQLARALGREKAARVLALAFEARDLAVDLIARHSIHCDLRLTGHFAAAVRSAHLEAMRADADELAAMGLDAAWRPVEAKDVGQFVGAPYVGGLFDPDGGHFHTLNYTLGLAAAARTSGVRMYEQSPVVSVRRSGKGVEVVTAGGGVKARHVVLAGDALAAGLWPRAEARIMPVANYIAVTEPLAFARDLIPSDAAVSDSRFVVNYYRLTTGGRLLFGGGERYSRKPPTDIAAFVRPHMERVFPRLRGVAIDYAWGGLVSITLSRLPHLARRGPVMIAHGYSGMGAVMSTLAGKLMVEELAGEGERFALLAGLAPPAFPGGAALRGPLHVAGMLWYALRDRF